MEPIFGLMEYKISTLRSCLSDTHCTTGIQYFSSRSIRIIFVAGAVHYIQNLCASYLIYSKRSLISTLISY